MERNYDCRYVALSYVWGGYQQLHLLSSNIDRLSEYNSIQDLKSQIPPVIHDAMYVVEALDESLLWVDSLCIVQDDANAKHYLIQEMASVYDRAALTLVACNGVSAGDNLPGVQYNSRRLTNLASIGNTDLHLSNSRVFKHDVDQSVYNTRGWTFQERLLSRRCLYFTPTQVVLECDCGVWSEDKANERHPSDRSCERISGSSINRDLKNLSSFTRRQRLLQYKWIIEEFSKKDLTISNDILDAFAGISAALKNLCGWDMTFGLPVQLLNRTLLWEQRAKTSKRTGILAPGLPSWSWAAWTGGVYYAEHIVYDLRILHSPLRRSKSPRPEVSLQNPPNVATAVPFPLEIGGHAEIEDENMLPILCFKAQYLSAGTFTFQQTGKPRVV